jgi:hydrogenase/urease accessory protein HupE
VRALCSVATMVASMCWSLWSSSAFAHGMSEEDKIAMLNGGYLQYVELGAKHMLTGYDHLLFLLGVMFFLSSARDVVKFVSAFTLGHCITLVGATFAGISANYFLVDAVIALSVCYKGFENNGYFTTYLQVRAPPLLWMVFAFGLVHGFGLSTRLQELPLGEDRLGILGRILSFNVGVEVGQVAALLVMVMVLTALRRAQRFAHVSRVMNDAIIAVGVLLLLMQLHGYLHNTNADDLGFSDDLHMHAHDEAARAAKPIEAPANVAPQHDNL